MSKEIEILFSDLSESKKLEIAKANGFKSIEEFVEETNSEYLPIAYYCVNEE